VHYYKFPTNYFIFLGLPVAIQVGLFPYFTISIAILAAVLAQVKKLSLAVTPVRLQLQ
jgi:hypothetical protein